MSGIPYRPRPDNGSGDSPRPPFLTEFVNHIREILFAHVVYHLIGGALALRVHPHVERPFRPKTESACRIAELQRTHAQIGQQPVRAYRRDLAGDIGVRAVQERDPWLLAYVHLDEPLAGQLQRLRVFIEANQMTLWAKALCDF